MVSGEPELPAWPVERPRNWIAWGNRPVNDEQVEGIGACVQWGRPLGGET